MKTDASRRTPTEPNRSVRLDSAAGSGMQEASRASVRGGGGMSETAEKPAKGARPREILEIAFEEFSRKGYAGASMAAIARRARASKETLYAWFENKETLYNTLLASRLDGLSSRVIANGESYPSPASVLSAIAEDVIRFELATAPLAQGMGAGESSDKALQMVGQTIGEWRARFVGYILECRAN